MKQDEAYNNMHFADDEVFSELRYINFKKVLPHSWKKLAQFWKSLNAVYKAALSRFTMSGMHLTNFYEFCNWPHDIYYLRKHLESKPNLVSAVVADLPEEVFTESIENIPQQSAHQLRTSMKKIVRL